MSDNGQSTENEPLSTPQQCMDIVQDYSKDLFTKFTAVKSILMIFNKSTANRAVQEYQADTTIGTYIAMLDQHDNAQSLAAMQGERSNDNQHEEDGDEHAPASKRRRSKSSGTHISSKKHVPDESLFSWLANDDSNNTTLSPNQELTWKLVQHHVLDLKASKQMVLGAKHVPEFPDSEWNNVLAGKAVNIDVIFSGMYSTIMDNRAIENIGDLELHLGAVKPAKTVDTHRDWVVAWRIVFKATHFIFPHRETELEEYNDYITSYFVSMHLSTHAKVLNLDRAIRKHIGSVNNVSLNEFSKFCYLSRLVISKDMVLAKAVPPPKINQSRGMLLTQCGGNLTHAASGMRGNVAIWHPLANFGTFVSAVRDHIAKGIVYWRRMSTLEWHHMAHCASEWSRYLGISAVCHMAINFKPPRFLLGAAKK